MNKNDNKMMTKSHYSNSFKLYNNKHKDNYYNRKHSSIHNNTSINNNNSGINSY